MSQAPILYSPRAVDRLDAVAVVGEGRWCNIAGGYCWMVIGPVVVLDGVLRLDGVVKILGY